MGNQQKLRVGIIGGSGYVGLELIRLLLSHPKTEIAYVTSREHRGKRVSDIHPSLSGLLDLEFSAEEECQNVGAVFISVPHTQSMKVVERLKETAEFKAGSLRLIDLGADFRLTPASFSETYQHPHSCPDICDEAVYGLPEVIPQKVASARILANPGCFAHCILLGLAPLLQQGALLPNVKVCAITGSSGSGAHVTKKTHHPERNESLSAYCVGSHRHVPEIEHASEIISAGSLRTRIDLVPISGPLSRGIYATSFITLKSPGIDVAPLYKEFSIAQRFVRLREDPPSPLAVRGSNFCDLFVHQKGTEVTIVGTLDNLVKGAAGNAIQCMNLMHDMDQSLGLLSPALYP